jgi:hypothetical protein
MHGPGRDNGELLLIFQVSNSFVGLKSEVLYLIAKTAWPAAPVHIREVTSRARLVTIRHKRS